MEIKNKGGCGFMRSVSLIVSFSLVLGSALALSGCSPMGVKGEYTYRTYTSALGTNWNPHTWETSADRAILDYLTTPLVSVLPLDSGEGTYQWSFDMALAVEDVTAHAREDIIRYGVAAEDATVGYVFEITLRDGMCFEDGRAIDAYEFVESMRLLLDPRMKNGRANSYISGESAIAGAHEYFSGEGEFDRVGLYAADRLKLRYITESYIDYNYFLASLGTHWLVNTVKYTEGIKDSGGLLATAYGTELASTSSYGPYRISSHQGEKELVLVRNERWYGWQTDDDGEIVSYTECEVDGERVRQYMTTKIVISVIDSATAKQFFTKGELSEWTPPASEYKTYRYSEGLYRIDETYTMSLFFNSDKEALLSMDRTRGNKNSVVLSSEAFRRGISLAIDRSEFALATEGYRPQYSLLNDAYYYDIYNDPDSSYRGSDEAKASVLRLYGIEWGDGERYATLDEAYDSVSGYDPVSAAECFREAFRELSEAGLYTEGEDIRIKVAWAKGALSADDNQQVALLNKAISLAAADSGFGKISLEPVGRVANRYAAVPAGEYAIGYGAWGGAAFYPFRAIRVYLDPDYENLHEGACWSPDKEPFTLAVDGVEVTMTYTEWARSLGGNGRYSTAEADVKLAICTALEEAFLSRYYRIPLVSSSSSVILSYQISNYTDSYSLMYGFGGFRLLVYHYDDYGWSEYVRSLGGRIRYE